MTFGGKFNAEKQNPYQLEGKGGFLKLNDINKNLSNRT